MYAVVTSETRGGRVLSVNVVPTRADAVGRVVTILHEDNDAAADRRLVESLYKDILEYGTCCYNTIRITVVGA